MLAGRKRRAAQDSEGATEGSHRALRSFPDRPPLRNTVGRAERPPVLAELRSWASPGSRDRNSERWEPGLAAPATGHAAGVLAAPGGSCTPPPPETHFSSRFLLPLPSSPSSFRFFLSSFSLLSLFLPFSFFPYKSPLLIQIMLVHCVCPFKLACLPSLPHFQRCILKTRAG